MNQSIIEKLKNYGFAKYSNDILTSGELTELKNFINQLFSDKSVDINKSSNALVIDNLAGIDPSIDFLLTKIITHEDVKLILNNVLGDNYKICEITVRRSVPGDLGLYLHQDGPGETGMSLLLTDNYRGDGATAFLSKSHQLPRWSRKIAWSSVALSSPFLAPLTGKIGDVGFFFNRTWHARLKNMSNKTHEVLLMSFYPQGATYNCNWDEESLKKITQPKLRRLFNPSEDKQILDSGHKQASTTDDKVKNVPYVLKLEGLKTLNALHKVKLLGLQVLILQVVFFPIRWLHRLLHLFKR